MAVAILAAMLFPRYAEIVYIVVFFACMIVMVAIQEWLNIRAMERRIAPVLEVLKRVGPMASREADYNQVLVERFFSDLTPGLKPESPLPSGTRVDTWMRYDGDDWYITVKRGLTNQQRLCLQGEIEDILLHSPKRKGHLWIVVVLGVPEKYPPAVIGQINSLFDYTIHRSSIARNATSERNVSIEVVTVELQA